jgi:hypothetical protein
MQLSFGLWAAAIILWLMSPAFAAFLAPRAGRSGFMWALITFLSVPLARIGGGQAIPAALSLFSPAVPLGYLALRAFARRGTAAPSPPPARRRLLFPLALLVAPFLAIYLLCRPFMAVKSLSSYTKVMADASSSQGELVAHFPPAAPPGATLAAFYNDPGGWRSRAWAARFDASNTAFIADLRRLYPPNGDAEFQWTRFAPLLKAQGSLKEYDTAVVVQKSDGGMIRHSGVFIHKGGRGAIFWATRDD